MRNLMFMLLLGILAGGVVVVPVSQAAPPQEPRKTFGERDASSAEALKSAADSERSEQELPRVARSQAMPGFTEPSDVCRNNNWADDLEFKLCVRQIWDEMEISRNAAEQKE
ncbi:MAG: hypothetical protein HY648_01180 [Acidobacteria bacterium]|nr:hypothetical protein [Acidobacteriota bacterium]